MIKNTRLNDPVGLKSVCRNWRDEDKSSIGGGDSVGYGTGERRDVGRLCLWFTEFPNVIVPLTLSGM